MESTVTGAGLSGRASQGLAGLLGPLVTTRGALPVHVLAELTEGCAVRAVELESRADLPALRAGRLGEELFKRRHQADIMTPS